ncbi:hypothetical protein NHX12_008918 [Muraenolepis orangiensis]|uniref:Histone-lysine N-methyltransferase n=1 Tax=Muraenolepis orangiensis TaxID=630683 RepID=A0A9Q0DLN9_9TELE|nr:hypothetical protein NHX12_008918 [Muraenolepis orangiensis]
MAHSCRWRFPARPGGSCNSGTGRRAGGRVRVTASLGSASETRQGPTTTGLGPGFDAALRVSSAIDSNLRKFRDVLGESSDTSSGEEKKPRGRPPRSLTAQKATASLSSPSSPGSPTSGKPDQAHERSADKVKRLPGRPPGSGSGEKRRGRPPSSSSQRAWHAVSHAAGEDGRPELAAETQEEKDRKSLSSKRALLGSSHQQDTDSKLPKVARGESKVTKLKRLREVKLSPLKSRLKALPGVPRRRRGRPPSAERLKAEAAAAARLSSGASHPGTFGRATDQHALDGSQHRDSSPPPSKLGRPLGLRQSPRHIKPVRIVPSSKRTDATIAKQLLQRAKKGAQKKKLLEKEAVAIGGPGSGGMDAGIRRRRRTQLKNIRQFIMPVVSTVSLRIIKTPKRFIEDEGSFGTPPHHMKIARLETPPTSLSSAESSRSSSPSLDDSSCDSQASEATQALSETDEPFPSSQGEMEANLLHGSRPPSPSSEQEHVVVVERDRGGRRAQGDKRNRSILREPTFRWTSLSRTEQQCFSSAKYAKEGLIRKPVFDNFRPAPLTAHDVGLMPQAGTRLFTPLHHPPPHQHPSSSRFEAPLQKRSPLLRAPRFTPSEAHSRIFESVTLQSSSGSSPGSLSPHQSSSSSGRAFRRKKRWALGMLHGQARSPSHSMTRRSSHMGSHIPRRGSSERSTLSRSVSSSNPSSLPGASASPLATSALTPAFSPFSAPPLALTSQGARDGRRGATEQPVSSSSSFPLFPSGVLETGRGAASSLFIADRREADDGASLAPKKAPGRKKPISADVVLEPAPSERPVLLSAAPQSLVKGRLHKKGRPSDKEAEPAEEEKEMEKPSAVSQPSAGLPAGLPGRQQLPAPSLGSMLAQAEKQPVTDKRVVGLLNKAKAQLFKIEKSKSLKSPDQPKIQSQESDSSEASVRGPRIKHVCRRAAVALGRNRAVFPDDMPTLSALPWEEREKILSSMGNDDKSSVAGSEEAEPQSPPLKPRETRIKAPQDAPPKKGRRSRRCGQCSGCQVPEDCGVCTNCLDKPKFGGRNIKKQCCKGLVSESGLKPPQAAQTKEEPLRRRSETPPPKPGEENSRQQQLSPAGSSPGPSDEAPPPPGGVQVQSQPQSGASTPTPTSESKQSSKPSSTQPQPPPQQELQQPPRASANQAPPKKDAPPKIPLTHELKQPKKSTPCSFPPPCKQRPKDKEMPLAAKPPSSSTLNWLSTPSTRGQAKSVAPFDGVHRIRVDFKRDHDVEKVWEDGGLSLLTSVPVTPRVLCFLCASSGNVEFVFCQVCCEPFHLFCLGEKERPLKEQWENWCCRRCRFCQVCGHQPHKSKQQLLECDMCRNSYHPECLDPNHPTKPTKKKRVWVCTKCVHCKSCGVTKPGKSVDAQWSHDFSMCHDCAKVFAKGNFCPLCDKCNDDDDYDSKMMQCGRCDHWVHTKYELYELMSKLPKSLAYTCSRCTERRPAEWRMALEKEAQGCVRHVLTALLNSRTSTHLLRYRQAVKPPELNPETEESLPSRRSPEGPDPPVLTEVTPSVPSDSPPDLESVERKLDQGRYKSVLEFSDDIVKVIQAAMNSDGGQPESRKANSMVKSFFIRQMERVFPWFKVKESSFWEAQKVSANGGLLPNAVLPPSLDHNYAQWQEREGLSLFEQPLLIKKIIPAPRPKAPGEPDSPTSTTATMGQSFLLPREGGRLLYIGQNEWTHVNCALWSAEVFEDDDGSLKNVHMAVLRGKGLRCEKCQRLGATVGCCLTSCSSNYHFMCARQCHCVFLEDKKVYCPRHRDLIKGEVVSGFEVTRRILVDLEGISLRRKWLAGLEPENVHMMIGSMTIDCLGILTEFSDCKRKLFPIEYQILVCRPPVAESALKSMMAPEENRTIVHSPPPSSAFTMPHALVQSSGTSKAPTLGNSAKVHGKADVEILEGHGVDPSSSKSRESFSSSDRKNSNTVDEDGPDDDRGLDDKHHEDDSDGSGSAKRRYPRRSARARSNMFFGLTPFYGVRSYGEEDLPFYGSADGSGPVGVAKRRSGGSRRSAEGQVDGADDMSTTSSSGESGEEEEGMMKHRDKDAYYYNFTRTIINPSGGLPSIEGLDRCLGRSSQLQRFLKDEEELQAQENSGDDTLSQIQGQDPLDSQLSLSTDLLKSDSDNNNSDDCGNILPSDIMEFVLNTPSMSMQALGQQPEPSSSELLGYVDVDVNRRKDILFDDFSQPLASGDGGSVVESGARNTSQPPPLLQLAALARSKAQALLRLSGAAGLIAPGSVSLTTPVLSSTEIAGSISNLLFKAGPHGLELSDQPMVLQPAGGTPLMSCIGSPVQTCISSSICVLPTQQTFTMAVNRQGEKDSGVSHLQHLHHLPHNRAQTLDASPNTSPACVTLAPGIPTDKAPNKSVLDTKSSETSTLTGNALEKNKAPSGSGGLGPLLVASAPEQEGDAEDSVLDSKPKKGIIFEIRSEDGFHIRCESIDEAWKSLTDKVQQARSNARLEELSFEGVNGLKMLGVVHEAVVFLLEQLCGTRHCRSYRFRFHKPGDASEPPANPHGAARAETHHRRSGFDMFNFLASKHRQLPEYQPRDEDGEDGHLRTARRVSIELPLSLRFTQLKTTSKETVGVYRSPIHGRGLFCKRTIDAGEMVIEYSGCVIRSVLTDKREKVYDGKGIGCYMFRIDDYKVVDATVRGNAARFINHACEPNCHSRVVTVDGRKHIVIFASRRVHAGEELTYDYKFPVEDVGSKLPCTCGAKLCRKFLN